MNALTNLDKTLADATLPYFFVSDFEETLDVRFPLTNGGVAPKQPLTAEFLGAAIGLLASRTPDVQPIVQSLIYSNIDDPASGYRLYLDGPFTAINAPYLQAPLWDANKEEIIGLFEAPLNVYLKARSITVDKKTVRSVAERLAEFERALAAGIDTAETQIEDINNPYTRANARREFGDAFDFDAYLKALIDDQPQLGAKLGDPNYIFAIASPSNWKIFSASLAARKFVDGTAIDDSTILNYILFRILNDKSNYLPTNSRFASPARRFARDAHRPASAFSAQNRRRQLRPPVEIPAWHPMLVANQVSQEEVQCTQIAGSILEFANDRLFVDTMFDQTQRVAAREAATKVTQNVANAFGTQIDELSWLSEDTKKNAHGKLDELQM